MKKAIVVFQQHGLAWNPKKPVREQAFWDDHARFIDTLFNAGKVVLGGPFEDSSGAMLVLALESVEEAWTIFANDPWALKGIQSAVEIKEWTIFLDRNEKG